MEASGQQEPVQIKTPGAEERGPGKPHPDMACVSPGLAIIAYMISRLCVQDFNQCLGHRRVAWGRPPQPLPLSV